MMPPADHHSSVGISTKPPKDEAYGLERRKASTMKSVTRPARVPVANAT